MTRGCARGDRLPADRRLVRWAGPAGARQVELNRAVVLSMAFGPAAGMELVDALVAEGSTTTGASGSWRERAPL
jgi:hypothetical protein